MHPTNLKSNKNTFETLKLEVANILERKLRVISLYQNERFQKTLKVQFYFLIN